MVDASKLKKAELVLKEKYNAYLSDKEKLDDDREKYLADKNELEERKVELNSREEKLANGEEEQEANQKKNKRWADINYGAEKKIINVLRKADFPKGEDLQEDVAIFTKEVDKFSKKEKTLNDLQKEIDKLNEELKEKKNLPQTEPEVPAYDFKNEKELVKHIKEYIASRGFYYEDGIIENFYTSLKAGYLVILSGISGVGKSKLPRLFAEAIGARFVLIPVRPDWNDDRDLLGFFNISTKQYQTTRFIEFLINANQNPDRLYIACFDEMNLAPVEYYFAQLLSQMETDAPCLNPPDETFTKELLDQIVAEIELKWFQLDRDLENEEKNIHQKKIKEKMKQLDKSIKRLSLYQNIPISPNVKFVGTVNMDHTTKGFSDKVLDRANVIQFENINIWEELPKKKEYKAKGLEFKKFKEFNDLDKEPSTLQKYNNALKKVSDILQGSGINIGFRVKSGILDYINLAIQGRYYSDNNMIFDSQIKQRVLPKIQGMDSKELRETLKELGGYFKKEYPASLSKITSMSQQLKVKGYVNYWEIK